LSEPTSPEAWIRCGFCLTLNRIQMARAKDRPKCGKCQRPILLDRPVKVDGEDFEKTVLQSQVPVLVDFYADWCGPCHMLAPHLDQIASEGVGSLLVVKLDSDRAPDLSQRFSIRGLPTVLLFQDGVEAGRVVGMDPAGIRALAEPALSPP
jgi:thioredoxin 2